MSAPPKVGIDGRGRLVAVNVYPWHESIKDLPGSRYAEAGRTAWSMPATPALAAALLTILSGTGAAVSPRVRDLATEELSRGQVRAVAADEHAPIPRLPWHDWLKTDPWRHQKRGIAFLRESSAAAIGAGMGTGKSLMVVGAANALEIRRLLIVAPAKAAGVWPREFRLHSACEWHVENGNRRGRGGALRRLGLDERWRVMVETLTSCACGKPHAVVVGYEAMAKAPLARADMLSLGIEMVCYDEAHRLKKAGGAASLTAFSWVNQIPRRAVLSGTLIPQTPADVYGTYRAVDPGIFGTNETSFLAEWIVMGKTKEGRAFPKDVFKPKRGAFSQKFHSILYLPTVDLKLPPVINSVRSVELEPAARKVYDSIRDNGIAEITEAVIAAGGNPTPDGDERTVAPRNAGVELTRLAQITGGATIDDEGNVAVISQAKRTALADLLEEVHCTKGGQDGRSRPEPVVVFCRFRPDLAAVREVAAKAGLRYREVSGSRKDGLDDDSKMHPDCDVLGVQIASGGEAIDFTRAHVVVWYSIGWELWRFQQAQKRVTRPGQTRPTLNYYLVVEDSIDGIIYASLAKKENVIDSVVSAYLRQGGGAEPSTESLPMMPTDADAEMVGAPVGVPDWLLGVDEPTRPPVKDDTEALELALAGFAGL
ncbi:MAG TPA: DEAD/DEAH box helicase [Pseudonocardiaceae bacterium]|nr:DEAD/DEAH box helicase [Pseudonocardiaceae bacterium]